MLNMLVGLILTGVVSAPAFMLLATEFRRPAFAPTNAWFWIALLSLMAFGCAISIVGLMRRRHWGYFAWSQTALSFLVSMIYIGWYRRELDYAKMGPDPEALYQGPPVASLQGFLILALVWAVIALSPVALTALMSWMKSRRGRRQADEELNRGRRRFRASS